MLLAASSFSAACLVNVRGPGAARHSRADDAGAFRSLCFCSFFTGNKCRARDTKRDSLASNMKHVISNVAVAVQTVTSTHLKSRLNPAHEPFY